MPTVTEAYNTRDFWIQENIKYATPNFRLRKCARIVNQLAQGKRFDLLDVGCGPAALRRLLDSNVNYHGIDMAIHGTAPFLKETNFVQDVIAYKGQKFDIVVALGVFEYMGPHQVQKFVEIARILRKNGKFVMSYINFRHVLRRIVPIYNNVQPVTELVRGLEQVFRVDRCFPVYHHWRHKEPGRNALPGIQMRMNCNIPLLSTRFAGEYFCICSPR